MILFPLNLHLVVEQNGVLEECGKIVNDLNCVGNLMNKIL